MTSQPRLDSEKALSDQRFARIAIFLVTLWTLSVTAVILLLSTSLRPIADDYALGEAAGAGLLPAIVGWWRTWSGDLSLVVTNTVLVGMPLQHLPWSLATAVPFVIAGLAVASCVSWLIGSPSMGITVCRGFRRRASLFLTVLVMWWAYWWVNFTVADGAAYSSFLARGVTFWQNVNSQYVVTVTLVIWAWLWLESRDYHKGSVLGICYLFWGLLAGMSGPVFALSSAMALFFVGAVRLLRSGWFSRVTLWILALSGIILGAAISHYSPGTQARARLVPPRSLDATFFTDAVALSDDAVVDWWVGIYNPGSLVVLLLVAIVAVLLGVLGPPFSAYRSTFLSLTFLGFALLVSLINRFSELLSYEAWWHVVTARTITWFGICLLGISLGSLVLRCINRSLLIPLLAIGGFAGVLLTMSGLANMADEVLTREKIWELGPAPLEGMGDIEPGSGWTESWLALRKDRGGPDREVGE